MHHIALSLLLLICMGKACADAVVTLCNLDNQSGPGLNLRDALAIPDVGRITFSCPSQTIMRITQVLELVDVIEIDGGNKITLDGGNNTSIFLSRTGGIRPGRTRTLRNLIIQNGKAHPELGHGTVPINTGTITITYQLPTDKFVLDHVKIINSEKPISVHIGVLVVHNSQFITNTSPVLNMGGDHDRTIKQLEVSYSTFKENHGSVFLTFDTNVTINTTEVSGRSDETDQGSVFNRGILKIRNSHFNNIWSRDRNQCGGALYSTAQTTIANSSFNNNRSTCGGGAVSFGGEGQNILTAVTFTGNQTIGHGGAIQFDNESGEIQIRHGEFRNNHADVGGAISVFSTRNSNKAVKAAALSFKGNSAGLGGAVYVHNGTFQLTRGIFVNNESTTGVISFEGTDSPPFVLANSLIVRNKSPVAIQGFAGDIINSTIADNDNAGVSVSGRLRLTNTVISNNKKVNCDTASSDGVIEDRGGNIQYPGTDCTSTIPSADPELDSFYVPDLESPLQRAGINDVCLAQPINGQDVYGQRHPRTDRCTIGAVEGDIQQMLNHIGITVSKAPLGGEEEKDKGRIVSISDGKNTVNVPLEWCLIIILILLAALLILYIKMKSK